MKTIYLFFVIVALQLNTAFTQPTIVWGDCFGGAGADRPSSVKHTIDGGIIASGVTHSNNGDITSLNGNSDGWVIKINSEGTIDWQKTYGTSGLDNANEVLQTTDGGYIFAGFAFYNDGDASGHHGGGSDFWVVKLNASGAIMWQKCYGGSAVDYACFIQPTNDNGYVIAGIGGSPDGDMTGFQGLSDFWIVKIDSVGTMEWQKSIGGTSVDDANCIKQTNDGGYIIAGSTESVNGDVVNNHGASDFWIVKLNSTGNVEWMKCLGGSAIDLAKKIIQTNDGGYMVVGNTQSNDGNVTGNHGLTDAWIVKLTSTGNIEWQKCMGGDGQDYAEDLIQLNDGGIIFVGYSYSLNGDLTANQGGTDCWIVKINSSGTMQWQKSYGSTNNDRGYSLDIGSDGGLIVANYTEGFNGDVSGSNGWADFWIVRFSSVQNLDQIQNELIDISLFPNPTLDYLNIKSQIMPENKTLTYTIYDLLGKKIMEETIESNPVLSLNIQEINTGYYFLNIKFDDLVLHKSFQKIK